MTTNRDLIARGFREAGIIEVGGVPGADEQEEAIALLQGLYSSFFGNELGDRLDTYNYGTSGLVNTYAIAEDKAYLFDSIYVPVNIRLIFNLDATKTLYLQPNPNDGARLSIIDNAGNLSTKTVTLNGNGRQIEGAATLLLNTNSLNRSWFFREDLGNWVRITDLALDDESSLPREFDDLLSTALAIRLNPRYGAQTSQEMGDILTRMRRSFTARYRQKEETGLEEGLYCLPSSRYSRYYGNPPSYFNKGKPFA